MGRFIGIVLQTQQKKEIPDTRTQKSVSSLWGLNPWKLCTEPDNFSALNDGLKILPLLKTGSIKKKKKKSEFMGQVSQKSVMGCVIFWNKM